jgi:hypothetical protein
LPRSACDKSSKRDDSSHTGSNVRETVIAPRRIADSAGAATKPDSGQKPGGNHALLKLVRPGTAAAAATSSIG